MQTIIYIINFIYLIITIGIIYVSLNKLVNFLSASKEEKREQEREIIKLDYDFILREKEKHLKKII